VLMVASRWVAAVVKERSGALPQQSNTVTRMPSVHYTVNRLSTSIFVRRNSTRFMMLTNNTVNTHIGATPYATMGRVSNFR